MEEIHGYCFICKDRIDAPSASSSMQHHGMRLGYVNGNGKYRIYCTNCISAALHIYTLIRPEIKRFLSYEST